jgi:hypothetical protein
VVGDLQHLGAQPRRPDRGEQVGLGLALHVAGEQDPPAVPRHPQHQRRVVRLGLPVPVRTARWRPEHLHDEVAEPGDLAPHGRVDHAAGGDDGTRGRVEGRVAVREGPCPQGSHVTDRHDVGQAADVVGVGVAGDEQVEPPAPARPQPPGRGVVDPGVHEQSHAGGLHEHRVALPDVDRGHHQTAGRSARESWEQRKDEGRQARECRQPPTGRTARSRERPRTHHDGQQHTRRAGERDSLPPAPQARGRAGDDGERRTGDREHDAAGGLGHERDDRAGGRNQGGDRRRRDREEVRRDGRERDLAAGGEQDREHRDLGAGGDREGEPRRAGQQAKSPCDHRGEHEHPEGRRSRQQQTEATSERGVDAHEHEHRAGERESGLGAAGADPREQREARHRRGAQHARLGAGQHDERHHDTDEQPSATPGPEPQDRREPHGTGHHDRDVAAADRGEVRQARVLHGLPQRLGQARLVAGDEAGRQRRQVVRQVPLGCVADPFADPRRP